MNMFDYYEGIKIIKDKKTGSPIGVEWKYMDGTKQRYYPDNSCEEWFLIFVDDVRKEQNASRKERNHSEYSIEDCLYEGMDFADTETPDYCFNLSEEEKDIELFFSLLTDVQKRRLQLKMDNPKISFQKIADIEGVSKTGIAKSFIQIRERYLRFSAQMFPEA